ncbi:RND family efflux transporter MFP subunit [Rhodopirellula maiorica SM1]|uniref:RND family efflux transporter MFP subunit n=1 Tax=Rhodopirellula maiorica SM1 TaxID=1265738 RepID=M5RUF2_9BACT|nr:efflux RND transporter periplasmic adaptor subunit [Rhodopirellula maiorica]EMI22973.1 RND family efflux transporter MFP subunit [Rhodopirellula maiorica SM1]
MTKNGRARFFEFLKRWASRLLFVPPLVVGLVVAVWIVGNRPQPELEVADEASRMLRVIEVPVVDVLPQVVGYGTATPGQTWQAVAQVDGRIVEVHPELESGSFVSKNQLLLKIDPTEYQYAVAQLEAEIEQAKALIEELTRTEENLQASLKIERDALSVTQREMKRIEQLVARNATAQSEVDAQQRAVLTQQQRLQEQSSALNLLPARKQSQQANLELKQAQLAQAELDLKHTDIRAPFDCRLGTVTLDVGQYVAAGQSLFEAYSNDLVEVEAQAPMREVRRLIHNPTGAAVFEEISMQRVRDIFNVQAIVEMASADIPARWSARFMRIRETLDPQTRSLSLVVGVDDPYQQVVPGVRPPLLQGTYCRVTLIGQARTDQVIVPRHALHDGHVYVLDGDQRLRRQSVQIEFRQSEFAVVRSGLAGGETLVVSDPTPAIEGMLVQPLQDDSLRERLVADARGVDANQVTSSQSPTTEVGGSDD